MKVYDDSYYFYDIYTKRTEFDNKELMCEYYLNEPAGCAFCGEKNGPNVFVTASYENHTLNDLSMEYKNGVTHVGYYYKGVPHGFYIVSKNGIIEFGYKIYNKYDGLVVTVYSPSSFVISQYKNGEFTGKKISYNSNTFWFEYEDSEKNVRYDSKIAYRDDKLRVYYSKFSMNPYIYHYNKDYPRTTSFYGLSGQFKEHLQYWGAQQRLVPTKFYKGKECIGHQYGFLHIDNKDYYIGEFCNDVRTGLGCYSWSNGDYYIGQFDGIRVTGYGAYYKINDKRVYVGNFLDKRKDAAFFIFEDKRLIIANYADNKCIGSAFSIDLNTCDMSVLYETSFLTYQTKKYSDYISINKTSSINIEKTFKQDSNNNVLSSIKDLNESKINTFIQSNNKEDNNSIYLNSNPKDELDKETKKALRGYKYKVEDDKIIITSTSVQKEIMIIPSVASKLNFGAFSYSKCSVIKKICVPKEITEIGKGCFKGCSNLEEIQLDAKIDIIKEDTFANTKIKEIKIPETVKKIEKNAFDWCLYLKKAYVPKKCKIHKDAFPSSCKIIDLDLYGKDNNEDNKFKNNINVKDTTKINNDVNKNKTVLDEIKIKKDSIIHLTRKDAYLFVVGDKIKTIDLENTKIESIEDEAFKDFNYITYLKLPKTLKKIGNKVFLNCKLLVKIEIPSSIESIGNNAFENCERLEYIDLSKTKINKISEGTFKHCHFLNQVLLPNSLKIIESEAFYNCIALSKLDMPINLEVIGDSAFEGCEELYKINFSEKLQVIGDKSFKNCSSIFDIDFPSSLRIIGKKAFDNCYCLRIINFSSSIEKIGEKAFRNSGVSSINLPLKLKEVEDGLFYNCKSLTNVYLPENLLRIGKDAFCNVDISEINLPSKLKEIDDGAFSNCYFLLKVNFPSSIERVGIKSFYGCSKLEHINFSHSKTKIDLEAFARCNISEINVYNGLDIAYSAFDSRVKRKFIR